MTTQQQFTPVSFHPDDMVSGGAFPVGNLLVQKSRMAYFQYNTGVRGFGMLWTLVADDGTSSDQFYSAGEPTKWSPSIESTPGAGDAGRYALPVSGEIGLNNNTNHAFLMKELINAGFPEAQVREGDAMRFEGLYALFEAKDQPKRTGGNIQQREGAKSAIPTQIHNLPWEPTKRGTLGPAVAPGAAPAAAVATNSVAAAPVTAPVVAPVAVATAPTAVATPAAPGPVVASATPPGASAPAVAAVPPVGAATPPGGPDVPTMQKVCLDAILAVLAKENPSVHAMVGAHIMQAHAADPQVNLYANYLFSAETHTYAATQGIKTENGQYQK